MGENQIYPYKILFVEDEESLRKNYISYLKMLFSHVYEAKDGEEALSLYRKERPDILIVDIHIPKIDGLELLKIIRKEDITTKAIILTAHINTEFLLKATSLKLVKYLKKPVPRKDLKEALFLAVSEISSYEIIPITIINLEEGYSWNAQSKELKHFNKSIDLTNKERLFLALLFSHINKVFSYNDIFYHVWEDYNETGSFNGLKNLIRRLRKKLPKDLIQNVFNEGYKIKI